MAEEGKVEAVARVNFWSPLRATIPRGSYPPILFIEATILGVWGLRFRQLHPETQAADPNTLGNLKM